MSKRIDVVIVEDDNLLAAMYQQRLQMDGYKVVTAEDAQDFWQKIAGATPKVVILDILLPKVNGLYILKEIRKTERLTNCAVIILTNLSRVEVDLTPELASVLGVKAYLLKSQTTPSTLIEVVKDII